MNSKNSSMLLMIKWIQNLFSWLSNGDNLGIITSVLTIATSIVAGVKLLKKWKSDRAIKEDLLIFFGDKKNVLEYRNHFIRTNGVDRPPDDEDDYKSTHIYANKVDLVNFFTKKVFKNDAKSSFLILADAGMGKTTFLVNLYLEYTRKLFGKNFIIKYVALGDPIADEYIEACKKDGSSLNTGGNTILLLDAFDEDPKAYENYSERFNYLINKSRTFAKVIITSRTQFFPEEDKEKFTEYISLNSKSGDYVSTIKKYIAPFTDKDVNSFLDKKYGWKFQIFGKSYFINGKRKLSENICEKATNLVVRPMLLENIDTLVKANKVLEFEYEIYETLIQSWILRESHKQMRKDIGHEDFFQEMNKFIEKAAINCYESFLGGSGLFVEYPFLIKIAVENSINLDKVDVSTRSLLNRNSKGRFKFSHKTILEFLLAKIDSERQSNQARLKLQSFDFAMFISDQLLLVKLIKFRFMVFMAYPHKDPLEQQAQEPDLQSMYTFERAHRSHHFRKVAVESIALVIEPGEPFYISEIGILNEFPNLDTLYLIDSGFFNKSVTAVNSGSIAEIVRGRYYPRIIAFQNNFSQLSLWFEKAKSYDFRPHYRNRVTSKVYNQILQYQIRFDEIPKNHEIIYQNMLQTKINIVSVSERVVGLRN